MNVFGVGLLELLTIAFVAVLLALPFLIDRLEVDIGRILRALRP